MERTRTDQLLYVELGTGNGGILLDVSEEGCGFLSIAPIWDEQPHFAFAIGGGRQIQGDGKVVWVDKSKKLGGLRFVNASPVFREQVRKWLAEPKVDMPQPQPKAKPSADILKPIEPRPIEHKLTEVPGDSLAKQRRKQLREEARARMELAEHASRPAESIKEGDVRAEESRTHGPAAGGLHEQIFLHAPSQRSWLPFLSMPGAWKGVAAVALGGVLVVFGTVYREQAGAALMRLGTSLAGKQGQVTPASENSVAPAPTVHPAPVEATTAPAEFKPPLVNEGVADKPRRAGSAQDAKQETVAAAEHKAPPRRTPQPSSTDAERSSPPQVVRKQSPTPEGTAARKRDSSTLQATAAVLPLETKKKETHHATAEQVQALWSEVEGGDVSAAVALGELYARGNGVPKSCGQARMLLNSAAKKGSDEARQKLEQLADTDCP